MDLSRILSETNLHLVETGNVLLSVQIVESPAWKSKYSLSEKNYQLIFIVGSAVFLLLVLEAPPLSRNKWNSLGDRSVKERLKLFWDSNGTSI